MGTEPTRHNSIPNFVIVTRGNLVSNAAVRETKVTNKVMIPNFRRASPVEIRQQLTVMPSSYDSKREEARLNFEKIQ